MIFRESETMELKEIFVDDIKKEIIAFSNCNGGKLYIGVKEDGSVVGVSNPDGVCLQISNMVRDTIKPDITMFIHYETILIDNKKIVFIDIQKGTNRPYYLAKKGMSPEGVYVRQGYSSVPATDTAIRQMIKESDGDKFEEMRSLNQNLTFEVTEKEFIKRKVDFGPRQIQTLKLINQDNLYSNLGLLLSDQCMHTIKVAVFQGVDQMIFKDRKEFGGSLIQQLNEVYEYLNLHNRTRSTIEKLYRIDNPDYPDVSIREALLNLLIHRDYTFSASSFISIYDNRIEFVSIGGLLPGLTYEDVMAGISVCRNQNLANIFYRLYLIEAYGTGLSKIMKSYEAVKEKPRIEITNNTFKVILPNTNSMYEVRDDSISYGNLGLSNIDVLSEEEKILAYVRKHGYISKKDVMKLFEVSSSTASRMLKRIVENNMLMPKGKARNTKYIER